MSAHNIIDNRNEKLADHVNGILDSREARSAVGYFFLSGMTAIAEKLDGVIGREKDTDLFLT
jgi:hypothetical protein